MVLGRPQIGAHNVERTGRVQRLELKRTPKQRILIVGDSGEMVPAAKPTRWVRRVETRMVGIWVEGNVGTIQTEAYRQSR